MIVSGVTGNLTTIQKKMTISKNTYSNTTCTLLMSYNNTIYRHYKTALF